MNWFANLLNILIIIDRIHCKVPAKNDLEKLRVKDIYNSLNTCAIVTQDFLDFTKSRGNDLTTPIPHWSFPGLKVGSKWCLCISRWLKSERIGKAPFVVLEATHQKALEYTTLEVLQKYKAVV